MSDNIKDFGAGQIKFGDTDNEILLDAFEISYDVIVSTFYQTVKDNPEKVPESLTEQIKRRDDDLCYMATNGLQYNEADGVHVKIAFFNKKNDEMESLIPLGLNEIQSLLVNKIIHSDTSKQKRKMFDKANSHFGESNWNLNFYLADNSDYNERKDQPQKEVPFILIFKAEGVNE